MGVLAQGASNGVGFNNAVPQSYNWGVGGALLSGLSPIVSGFGQMSMANFQSQIAQNNSAIMRQNATATVEAGDYAGIISKLRTGQEVGAEKAAQGANNIDVGIGSAPAVREATQNIGAMDAAMIHYNAARAAYGQQQEAANLGEQAKIDTLAGRNAVLGGLFKSGQSFLSSATSLGQKWSQYQLYGAT